MFLLLCGGPPSARAQVVSTPNQVYGRVEWTNDPLGPVYAYLNSPTYGMTGGGTIYASSDTSNASGPVGPLTTPGSYASVDYTITVQTSPSGISYTVTPEIAVYGGLYYFAPAISPPVLPACGDPSTCPVLLNFSECAGLIEVQFCDAAGTTVVVDNGLILAGIQFAPSDRQSYTYFNNSSHPRLIVRGGNTFNVSVSLPQTLVGNDPFSNQFSLPGFSVGATVTVGCDEIAILKIVVPPPPIGPGGEVGSLGRIVGIADVLREDEHWINLQRTLLYAFNGPGNNFRYANIGLLTQPGYLPCGDGSSPAVGTPACNSAGPFNLINLLPSDFSTPSHTYDVAAGFCFGLDRRYEFFGSPVLYGVTVPSIASGAVDLGNTFVINPGYVKGDVFLCGPDEGSNANSCLRYIYRASDSDGNLDEIPDDTDLNISSKLYAFGGVSANGGVARVLFEGDFVSASGPNQNHFVGDYKMTLGGFGSDPTHWNLRPLELIFSHGATPEVRDSYLNSTVQINNEHFADVEVVPEQTVQYDHRYGFSQLTISFHSTSGTLFDPVVGGAGNFTGLNFEGQAAQYTCGVNGFGTPRTLATATSDGQVVLCIPEGTYTFNPTVESVNPDGISSSHNTLPSIDVTVGPCEIVNITPGLVLNVDPIPECVAQPELTVSGSVTSTAEVASITYTLNGHTVIVCTDCGINPAFSFNLTLANCDNPLVITATDVDGRVSSRSKNIHFDSTPPDLGGCDDLNVTLPSGHASVVVNYPAVTATDGCDGPLSVTCDPPSGSAFVEGVKVVHCVATDACGNTATCSFTVTVNPTPPTAVGLVSFTAVRSPAGRVSLGWQTGVEFDLLGFWVERQGIGGMWFRVGSGVLPSSGSSQPNDYLLEDLDAPTLGTAVYRLVELDTDGFDRVVAQTTVQIPLIVRLGSSRDGLELTVEGPANRNVMVETTTDAWRGLWTELDRVKLDAAGTSRVMLKVESAQAMRFYRARAE